MKIVKSSGWIVGSGIRSQQQLGLKEKVLELAGLITQLQVGYTVVLIGYNCLSKSACTKELYR